MDRIKCCNFCVHYSVQEVATIFTTDDQIYPGRGVCRFYPPVVIMTEQEAAETVWPQVHGLDCCSKFRRPSFLSKILDKLFPARQYPQILPHTIDGTDPEHPGKRFDRGDDRRVTGRRRYEQS